VPLDGPHEVEVLHDGHLGHAANGVQHRAVQEDRLVAVGEPQQGDPHTRAPLDDAEAQGVVVDAKAECAARDARVGQRPAHRRLPALR
jgi:hypothetical protein